MLQKPDKHTERVLKLAAFLDELPSDKFSLSTWGTEKEPRCICGWFMHNMGRMDKYNWEDAGRMLGMPRHISAKMFGQARWRVTGKDAAKALRHYAVTGEFNAW